MFEKSEARTCPECGLALKRLEELPKAKVVGGEVEEIPPDEEILPWTYTGRGRGPLVLVALLGVAAFFLPWVKETAPERIVMSGPQIASHLGWMWAPLVAWLVMIPLVLSRRNVFRMRGARVAVGFLAGMSLMTIVVRMAFKPAPNALDPHIIDWAIGMYVTGVLSVVAIALSFVFGGRIDDLTSKKKHHRSGEETLH
ncbi:MAG: hypothetical protein HOW73_51295 [Polyangiaceae bacterium]|nr:hypothetical protein [Polyangiaceae bacterium]